MKTASILILAMFLSSCGSEFSRSQSKPRGSVLKNGESITIEAPSEKLKITHIDSFTREIKRNDITLNVSMLSRAETFKYPGQISDGIDGIYNPGNSSDLGHKVKGYRIVYQESVINF